MVAPRKIRRCRGISLVEIVAVIVAGSALMGVTVAALVAVKQADQRFTRRLGDRQAFGGLAEQLRDDVHAGRRVAWDAETNELTLEFPADGRVVYRRVGRRWERRERSASTPEPQLAGAFRLPSGADFTIEPVAAETGALVRMAWTTAVKSHDPWRNALPRYEVAAIVGRDLVLLDEGAQP